MEVQELQGVFPDYFSKEIIEEIINCGAKEQTLKVYRVAKQGENNKDAFLNYYEEVIRGIKIVRNKDKYLKKCLSNIDSLAISTYYDIKDAKYYCDVTLREKYPNRKLLEGFIEPKFGVSQITKERKEKKDSHVDWWLYKNATPWLVFKEVDTNG